PTTTDSARVAGALAGASLVASMGMVWAYAAVTTLYTISLLLTFGTARRPQDETSGLVSGGISTARASPLRDVADAFAYVWRTPHLLAGMTLALLVNLCAYPLMSGVLPYVAREVYGTGQAGLGYLAASFAFGALVGSVGLSANRRVIRPGRMMIVFTLGWFAMLQVFAWVDVMAVGIVVLMIAGLCQSVGMVPLSVMLMQSSDPRMRARVLGLRMLAIYGLPMGLLASGPIIEAFGFGATATGYGMFGMIATALIAWRWHAQIWRLDGVANGG
ncbi:MAG: MFS transporter, partial [Alphaproteobacteria bacterium]